MNRHHRRVLESEGIANDFHQRHETVRRARGIRDDVMLGGIVLLVVYAQDDRQIFIFRRRMRAAATIFIARVIWRVLLTVLMRFRMSFWLAIVTQTQQCKHPTLYSIRP